MSLPWLLLRFDVTTIGHRKWMVITHQPTGISVRGDGESVSDRALKARLLPQLEVLVAQAGPGEVGAKDDDER